MILLHEFEEKVMINTEKNIQKVVEGDYLGIKPVTAEFVPTLNCNFQCNQCSYAKPKKQENVWGKGEFSRKAVHMDKNIMKIALDRLIEGGVKNILFTGGGEPFMNKEVVLEGMRYAKEHGRTIGLYTNASLLNEKIIQEIFEIDPLFIRISLYGSNEKSFSAYTGQKSEIYSKVIENIKLLTINKQRSNASVILSISYLLHPYTIDNIGLLSDMFFQNFSLDELNQISYIRFTPAVDYFGGKQHSQKVMEEVFRKIEDELKPNFKKTTIEIKPYHHRLADLNTTEKSYDTCRASGWFIEVAPNGDVFLCCEKLFLPDYKIGNLIENSIDEIYASQLREDVIAKVNHSFCKDCPPLCKPHERNKIFNKIELLRANKNNILIDNCLNDLSKLSDFES